MTDVWGAISIPLAPISGEQAAGDPALTFIGDFLVAFLTTDQNATAQWSVTGVAATQDPVKKFIVGRPDDKTRPISVAWLPALFLFRNGGTFDRWGDDWDVVKDKVIVLWVLPISGPEVKRAQLPFANALVKCVYDAIELGRTPSWVQPGDPEPIAQTIGSLLYSYADFVHFTLQTWRTTFVHVDDVSGRSVGDFSAVEMTFEMIENRVIGTDSAPYQPLTGADMTVANAVFVPFQTWTASTFYTVGVFVVPPTSNGSFYVCTFDGTSGTAAPVLPLAPGNTVVDGQATWQCVGPTAYTRWTAATGFALNAFVIPPTANGFYYQATTTGTTGATAPTFPTTPGATVSDGTVVWTCVAATIVQEAAGPLETIAPTPV